MIPQFLKYVISFIAFIALQVMVINNITLFSLLHPYVYFMFLLILPMRISNWALLLISFLTGLVMDFFTGSLGMHASACVFLGFIRPFFLLVFRPKMGLDEEISPHAHSLGLANYLLYAFVLTLLHHAFLHLVEVFEFTDFGRTLLRIILNSGASFLLILVIELLVFYRNPYET